jgi:hypothetical protein
MRLVSAVLGAFLVLPAGAAPLIDGCPVFPSSNAWNQPIETLPRHPNSDAFIATIGAATGMHPDFGTVYEGAPIGIPFVTVPGSQARVAVTFDIDDESDPGPYPIPPGAPIEGGPASDGDRHVIAIDRDNCVLYEMYSAYPNGDGSWSAGSGAIFNLRSNAVRPKGWTSADAAGLAIFPGLARYDEVAAGEIAHALRFTAPQTRRAYVWPARHYASSLTGDQYPPMGLRMRLKAGFDISTFPAPVQVILRALKKYGMILADNGSRWYISGAPDSRWDDDMLVSQLARVKGSDFEAVDGSNSGARTNDAAARPHAGSIVTEYHNSLLDHYFMTASDADRAFIDAGDAGPGWSRTGNAFNAWAEANADSAPVCRFYGNAQAGADGKRQGPNSHLFTIDGGTCASMKKDAAWIYEGIAFHAIPLAGGTCPDRLQVLWRARNDAFPASERNDRYGTDRAWLEATSGRGWRIDAAAMCVE